MLATGVIALMLFKCYQNIRSMHLSIGKKIVRAMGCMIAGVSLHFFYNFALEQGRMRIYIVVII